MPATKEAATRVDPPVTTSIALTEKTYKLALYFNRGNRLTSSAIVFAARQSKYSFLVSACYTGVHHNTGMIGVKQDL